MNLRVFYLYKTVGFGWLLIFLRRFDASINKKRTYLIDMFFQFF